MNQADEHPCFRAIVSAIEVVSGKWSYSVISQLCQGTQRFNQLRRSLPGISIKSLTDTLRHLEQRGIISRNVVPTVPVTVEYALTESGRAFNDVLVRMRDWGLRGVDTISKIHIHLQNPAHHNCLQVGMYCANVEH